MPKILPWYLCCAVLIKTSLLGLGLVTIGLSVAALILLKIFGQTVETHSQQALRRIFKTSIQLHLATYALLITKLIWIDAWQDIPAFILGHLVMHHVMSALIATVLILLTVRVYNQRQVNSLQFKHE